MNIEEMLKHIEEYKRGDVNKKELTGYLMDFGADAYGEGANSVVKNAKNNISVEALAKIVNSYNRGLTGARSVIQYIVNML
jgi:hypothetical protein